MAERIAIVAYSDADRSVTIAVDGVRYEYELGDAYWGARSALHYFRFAPGRQLNWLKQRGKLHDSAG